MLFSPVVSSANCLVARRKISRVFSNLLNEEEKKFHSALVSIARFLCRAGKHMIQFVERRNVVLHNIFSFQPPRSKAQNVFSLFFFP